MESLKYQGVGVRFAALLVDTLIMLAVLAVLVAITYVGGTNPSALFGFYLLLNFLYFVGLEGASGATIGKRLMKIKVVREDGSACGIGPALVRNLLRIVDVLPILYVVGILLISRSEKKQRLGDTVARTVVVKPNTKTLYDTMGAEEEVPPKKGPDKFCINCGNKLPADAVFCGDCGTPTTNTL